MNIRPAFSDDCPALAAIDTVSNPSPWSVKQFASALAQSTDKLWVCETDGVVSGFIVWQDILDESELHLIATAPEYRRQGIAAALLEHWFRHAQTAGITRRRAIGTAAAVGSPRRQCRRPIAVSQIRLYRGRHPQTLLFPARRRA